MDDLSWAEIKQIADSGVAQKVFSVGDKKSIELKKPTGDTTNSSGISFASASAHAQIVDFLVDTKTNGQKAPITFVTEELVCYLSQNNDDAWKNEGSLRKFLQNNREEILGSELSSVVSQVKKKTYGGTSTGNDNGTVYRYETSDYLFVPSNIEVGFTNTYTDSDFPSATYDYFSSNSRRIEAYTSSPRMYILRDSSASREYWFAVSETGRIINSFKYDSNYLPLAFCI